MPPGDSTERIERLHAARFEAAILDELLRELSEQRFFYYLAGVPLLGILAQWLAWRLRLPSILLLLGLGVALGRFLNPDRMLAVLAGADPNDPHIGPRILFPLVSLSVAVIMFEGGLTLSLRELRASGTAVARLVTIGAAVSWALTAVAAWFCLGLDPRIACLVGAILVVTGPTVVSPMLRQIQPTRKLAAIIKWEGIVIDPIGAVLAVLVFEVVAAAEHSAPWWTLLKIVVVGCGLGLAVAALLVFLVKRYFVPDYLHGVLFLTAALGAYALSNLLQNESGLLTVTVLGIALANQRQISLAHVLEFKEHLRVLLISCLFIVLGSRVDPGSVWNLGPAGLAFLAIVIVAARPASVLISTWGAKLSLADKLFVAALAPRGIVAAAVSSVFALRLAAWAGAEPGREALAEQAAGIVPITFLIIVGTVSFYGLFTAPFARWLKVADPNPQGVLLAGADPWIRDLAQMLQAEKIRVLLVDTNHAHVTEARMTGLAAECASILSDQVREELDLAGIGRLLALTSNDEVNALAVREFAYFFGRANVFQLAPIDSRSGVRQSVPEHLRGRLLFSKGLDYQEFTERLAAGWQLKKTRLTPEYTHADFLARYGATAVPLFVIDEARNLHVAAADSEVRPRPGHTLIALVDKAAFAGEFS